MMTREVHSLPPSRSTATGSWKLKGWHPGFLANVREDLDHFRTCAIHPIAQLSVTNVEELATLVFPTDMDLADLNSQQVT